jgi:DNA-binding FadR family transcriptional regulator
LPLKAVRQLPNGRVVPAASRLGDQLAQRIASDIQRGNFDEAGKLPAEAELAERFGVSRPVIREALTRLRAMGFITSRRGSGSYLRRQGDAPVQTEAGAIGFGPLTSLAQVRHCFEFRATIEGDAAYYAAQFRTAEMLDAMRRALGQMEEAIGSGAVGMSADFDFHFAVAQASGNEFYGAVMEGMRTHLEFAINLARTLAMTYPRDHLMTVQGEHVATFHAIEARDAEAARLAMRTHIQHACQRVFEGPGSHAPRPAG